MIRMLTPVVREAARRLAIAEPTPDPLLDPRAGVVHGDGPIPVEYQPVATIDMYPGPAQPVLEPAPGHQRKPFLRRRRASRASILGNPFHATTSRGRKGWF
jgi:hypothetical protein